MADPDFSKDREARTAYEALWAAHPELNRRELTSDPVDEALWREFTAMYTTRSSVVFDPHKDKEDPPVPLLGAGVTVIKAQKWIPARTSVRPEIAGEILKNTAAGNPPFRPELGEVGQVSWFTTAGNPYVGVDKTKSVEMQVEVLENKDALVFREADLVTIRDQFKNDPTLRSEVEASVKAAHPAKDPQGKGFRDIFERALDRAAEKSMWRELGSLVRTSKAKVGRVILQNSEFSRSGDGEFYLTNEASNIRLRGGVPEVAKQIARDQPGLEVPEAVKEAAEKELVRVQQVGKVKAAFRIGGRILLVVAIAVDVYRIITAQDKVKTTVHVVGGWAGASLAGSGFAAAFAPADVAGPWAWVVHGVGTLVAGGVGYWVGSEVSIAVYEVVIEG